MDKKEIAEVLETILDGLTAGESTEKKLEETKKFYESELAKVNTEKQFYERVIRFCLFERYAFSRETALGRVEPLDGSKLFFHQSVYNSQCNTCDSKSIPGLSPDDFDRFVEEYLTTARNDNLIGIKEGE